MVTVLVCLCEVMSDICQHSDTFAAGSKKVPSDNW